VSVLVIAEHDNSNLKVFTLNAISAASKKVPLKLLKTLKTKGKIIFPREYFPRQQKLLLLKKLNEFNYSTQELFYVSFVPLL